MASEYFYEDRIRKSEARINRIAYICIVLIVGIFIIILFTKEEEEIIPIYSININNENFELGYGNENYVSFISDEIGRKSRIYFPVEKSYIVDNLKEGEQPYADVIKKDYLNKYEKIIEAIIYIPEESVVEDYILDN